MRIGIGGELFKLRRGPVSITFKEASDGGASGYAVLVLRGMPLTFRGFELVLEVPDA